MTKIKEIPENDRPIERLLKIGASNLSNEELISILLRTGNKNESSKELASKLISEVGGLKKLKQITLEELLKFKGIGLSKATILLSCIEISKRINSEVEEIRNIKGNHPELIFKYYKSKLEDLGQEHFYVLYLDTNKKIIKDKLLFIGTINYSMVHPRDIFKEAYLSGASSIILVHNHPTGNIIPSKNDIDTTLNLIESGKLLGISVVDHIIIGKHKYYSFYENGDI